MTQVCFFIKMRHDPEMNQYSWIYTGGCFKNNEPVNYEDLAPNQFRDFKNVQFEVRLDHREWEEIDLKGLQEEPGFGEVEQESEEEKQARLEREGESKANQIEDLTEKNSGMYKLYVFFLLITIFSFLGAVVSFAMLLVDMFKGDEE